MPYLVWRLRNDDDFGCTKCDTWAEAVDWVQLLTGKEHKRVVNEIKSGVTFHGNEEIFITSVALAKPLKGEP